MHIISISYESIISAAIWITLAAFLLILIDKKIRVLRHKKHADMNTGTIGPKCRTNQENADRPNDCKGEL